MNKTQIPNCITVLRIIGTIILMNIEAFSREYGIIYTICGVSDIADGYLARKFHVQSDSGAKLDSAADLIFYGAALYRVAEAEVNDITYPLCFFVTLCIMLRLFSYMFALVKFGRFSSLHTYANKLTGAGVFLITYLVNTPYITEYCTAVCIMGSLAAYEEILIHFFRTNMFLTENVY